MKPAPLTDDDRIADAASVAGASVTRRPDELAGDAASSESVLLHALDEHRNRTGQDAEVLVMVQCTSPFLTASEIADCVAAVEAGADGAFTAAPSHGFLWQRDDAGDAVGVNHDKATRPRRQDRTPEFLETGAVYAMRADGFRRSGHRFFGRTVLIETDPARVLEIDEPDDLERARLLAPVLDADASAPHRTDLDAVCSTSTAPRPTTRCWWRPTAANRCGCTAVTDSASPHCAAPACRC